jgi:hypothetical protein
MAPTPQLMTKTDETGAVGAGAALGYGSCSTKMTRPLMAPAPQHWRKETFAKIKFGVSAIF